MTKKIFISQLMQGLSDEQIQADRQAIIEIVKKEIGDDFEVIDSIIKDECPEHTAKNRSVWYLGNAILKLAEADLAVFGTGWGKGRGTAIENTVAKDYGIRILEL
jgi:chaperone required for assembly of F1-ATPase